MRLWKLSFLSEADASVASTDLVILRSRTQIVCMFGGNDFSHRLGMYLTYRSISEFADSQAVAGRICPQCR